MSRKPGAAPPLSPRGRPSARGGPPALPQPAEREVMVAFPVPETLHVAIKVRAAQERTTVRGVLLRALKALGLDVPDAELGDRRIGRAGRPPKER